MSIRCENRFSLEILTHLSHLFGHSQSKFHGYFLRFFCSAL
nr:MAG TPA: hypothetical protein [Caudoviricetes sp.]